MKIFNGENLKILDKKSVFIDKTVKIGKNVVIYENNRIEGDTEIGDNVVIMPNCYIKNCKIGKGTIFNYSQAEDAVIGENTSIGPFARLRPNAKICDNAKIGNFVEIKNSVIGKGTKVSHLAYVGDADVGKDCNIGCGVIFVNYNGKTKNRSTVGDNCFIGSNCNIIAPVNIASDSYICAGTTITDDIKSGDFVIGRVRQEVKEGRAYKYLKNKE